jgi:hypothetical protein
MKLLTLKDFITYNNPCFSCQENTFFRVITRKLDDPMAEHPITKAGKGIILHPVVTPQMVDMDLKVNYSDGTLNLRILHKSNKIISDINALTDYLSEHIMYATSKCTRCGSYIRSHSMLFDLDKKILKPLSIRKEFLLIEEPDKMYSLTSNWDNQESILMVAKTSVPTDRVIKYEEPIDLKMPLQPLSKFKNKQTFINKMNTLILFS